MEPIRQELKAWEAVFKEIHGRKPSKSDVDIAPKKIRTLYRDYSILRNGGTLSKDAGANISTPTFRLKRPDFTLNKIPSPNKPRPKCEQYAIYTKPKSNASEIAPNNVQTSKSFLGGVCPRFCDQAKEPEESLPGRNQFAPCFHSLSPAEIVVKRQNLCNLVSTDTVIAGAEQAAENAFGDPEYEESDANDGYDAKNFHAVSSTVATKSGPPASKKSKPKSTNRANNNFVRLDMKHKRYQCKALKRLKGAALKRFLFRQQMRKHRNR